jgi:hypothetical protein
VLLARMSLTYLDDQLFQSLNSLAGRSWLVDTLMGYPLRNSLVKGAVIGACFMAAWYSRSADEEVLRRRRSLLAGILAAVLALAASKTMADWCVKPRPYVESSRVFAQRGDELVEQRRLPFRIPREHFSEQRFAALQRGDLQPNDTVSFPSDHAALYVAVSLGILWASRGWGLLALGWTLLVPLGSKVLHGMHSPIDVAAGSALAGLAFAGCQGVAATRFGGWLDRLLAQFERHRALGSGLLFVVVFEITCTLANAEEILSAVLKRLPH